MKLAQALDRVASLGCATDQSDPQRSTFTYSTALYNCFENDPNLSNPLGQRHCNLLSSDIWIEYSLARGFILPGLLDHSAVYPVLVQTELSITAIAERFASPRIS